MILLPSIAIVCIYAHGCANRIFREKEFRMDINEIRGNVANNLSALRIKSGMTQAQLAEILNYTDKAVSKWERAESVPDIAVLWQIAELYGVTVDWLICDHGNKIAPPNEEEIKAKKQNRLLVSLLSSVGVWFVATIVFMIFQALEIERPWLPFIWAVPATAIDLLVFNALWGKYKANFLFITLIIWSIPAALYITIANWSLWYLFVLSVPLQIATIFWSQIKIIINPQKLEKKKKKEQEREKDKEETGAAE